MIRARLVLLLVVLVLPGCASDPVPDQAYYSLDEVPATATPADALRVPLEVQPFLADGVYNEQAILYINDAAGSLRGYHYQLWSDPPVRLLQRRLIATLRAGHVAPLVADRLPAEDDVLRVIGLIQHFERVKVDGAWTARVQLEFRVEGVRGEKPLLIKQYQASLAADDDTMPATVRAFGVVVDRCFAELVGDLKQVGARKS